MQIPQQLPQPGRQIPRRRTPTGAGTRAPRTRSHPPPRAARAQARRPARRDPPGTSSRRARSSRSCPPSGRARSPDTPGSPRAAPQPAPTAGTVSAETSADLPQIRERNTQARPGHKRAMAGRTLRRRETLTRPPDRRDHRPPAPPAPASALSSPSCQRRGLNQPRRGDRAPRSHRSYPSTHAANGPDTARNPQMPSHALIDTSRSDQQQRTEASTRRGNYAQSKITSHPQRRRFPPSGAVSFG